MNNRPDRKRRGSASCLREPSLNAAEPSGSEAPTCFSCQTSRFKGDCGFDSGARPAGVPLSISPAFPLCRCAGVTQALGPSHMKFNNKEGAKCAEIKRSHTQSSVRVHACVRARVRACALTAVWDHICGNSFRIHLNTLCKPKCQSPFLVTFHDFMLLIKGCSFL